jgi:molybdenum cofactor cytidylyltransferase
MDLNGFQFNDNTKTQNHMQTATAIIILAAGKSSRLGHPKQLLPFKGKSLINHCIETAKKVSAHVLVITGADKMRIESEIKNSAVTISHNPEWEEGMASSIRHGLSYLNENLQNITSVIFMVCDQPFVSVELLQNLIIEQEKTHKSIVASYYSKVAGTPVLFDKSIFPELMELTGDTGARKIITRHKDKLTTVAFPLGNIDMDTADDYKKLMMQKDLL